jgi:peptide/nickel transport system substrate-binding protein
MMGGVGSRGRRRWPGSRGLLLLLLVSSTIFGGCGSTSTPSDGRSRITVLSPFDESIFNPSWDMWDKFVVFLPLVGITPDGDLEPKLALRWESRDGGREWIYHLRSDVRWHDGVPFTARDVAFTYEMFSHPEVHYYPEFSSADVLDDSTVVVRFTRPVELDWYIVFFPSHLLESLDPASVYEWDFWNRPVGNGPYRYVRSEPKTFIEFEANPDYFRGKPAVDVVVIKFGQNALAELLSGQVDAAPVSRADLERLAKEPKFRIHYGVDRDMDWSEVILWNHRRPFFDDARVRRALTMAMDRAELRQLQGIPASLPLFDAPFTPTLLRDGAVGPALPYDPERAADLLDEAGWTDSDGNGVRDRAGQEFQFTLSIGAEGADGKTSGGSQAAIYLQDALRAVGVVMEIEAQPAGLQQRLRRGDFDAAITRFFKPQADYWFGGIWSLGYENPVVTELLAEAGAATDPVILDGIYRELQPVLQADMPVTFLSPEVSFYAARADLTGFRSPFRAHPLADLEHVRIEGSP